MMCTWRIAEEDRGTRLNACLAALEIQEQIEAFNREHPDKALPIRIGLNVGQLALANIGGTKHGGYEAIGEVPNGAERIEGLNKLLGTSLLAPAQLVEGLDELETRRFGLFIPYGMLRPLDIFEILRSRSMPTDALEERFRRYASAFKRSRAVLAIGHGAIRGGARQMAEWPAQFFRQRCRERIATPPTHEPPWVIRVETSDCRTADSGTAARGNGVDALLAVD